MLHKITHSLRSGNNSLFTGKVCLQREETDSTNAELRDLARRGEAGHGTVLVAEHQRVGRGQAGRSWQSDPGANLLFSLWYEPDFLHPAQLPLANRMVALALLDAVTERLPGVDLRLKWPNDLLAGGKKLAGILIETQLRERVEGLLIGIGVNVNQRAFPGLPDATSMALLTEAEHDRHALLDSLCESLEAGYLLLRRGGAEEGLDRRYHEHLFGLGERRRFQAGERIFTAVVKGVDEDGRLRLATSDGEERFGVGEIAWLGED